MFKIQTDAAFRQRTQEAGIGIIIQDQAERHLFKYYVPTIVDNHMGEFMALKEALKISLRLEFDENIVMIQSDSRILVDSVEKLHAKNGNYQTLLNEILELLKHFDSYFIQWIPEKKNLGPDQLARQALNQQGNYEVLSSDQA